MENLWCFIKSYYRFLAAVYEKTNNNVYICIRRKSRPRLWASSMSTPQKTRQKFFWPSKWFKPCLTAFWSKKPFLNFWEDIFFFGFSSEFFEKRVPEKSVFWVKITQNHSKWPTWSNSRKISFRFQSLTAMYYPGMGFLPIYQPFLASLAHFSLIFALIKCLWGSLRAFCDTFRCILPELAKMSNPVKITQNRVSSLTLHLHLLLQIMVSVHFSISFKVYRAIIKQFYPL